MTHTRLLWGCLLVAVTLRVLAGWSLTGGPEPLPFPDDAPYHWIRMTTLVEGTVDLHAPDPGSGFPLGARVVWPWGFDLGLVWLANLARATRDPTTFLRFVSSTIPLLGASLLPLLFLVSRRLSAPRVAVLAVALLAVMPFHVQYTMMGRVDHHVLEPIATAVGLWGILPGTSRLGTAVSGLVQGLSFGFFPAAPYPVLTMLALGGTLAALERPGEAVLWAVTSWLGTAASLSLSSYAGEWVFFAPSRTHLVLTALSGLGIVGTAASRRWMPRWGSIGAIATGLVAMALSGAMLWIAFPPWLGSLLEGLAYLARGGFARLSFEAQSLLEDPLRAWALLGVAAPVGLLGLWRMFRETGVDPRIREGRRRVALLTVPFLLGALLQRRFVMMATPFLALVTAEGLHWAGLRIAEFLERSGSRRRLVRTLLGVGIAGVLIQDAGQALALTPWQPRDEAFLQAARRVAERFRQDPSDLRRGVLASWGWGHLVRWASGLPVVCDNFFGAPDHDRPIRDCMGLMLETDEATATRMLDHLRVRFVILAPPHPEEVRAMASLLGIPPETLVDDRGRFTARFARTAWARWGLFASTARDGDRGPLGTTSIGNVRVRDPVTGEVEAEVVVLEIESPSPDGPYGKGLYSPPRVEDNASDRPIGDSP